jgi:hypothetical protein
MWHFVSGWRCGRTDSGVDFRHKVDAVVMITLARRLLLTEKTFGVPFGQPAGSRVRIAAQETGWVRRREISGHEEEV